jgi:chromosome transmission fidelity protein 1
MAASNEEKLKEFEEIANFHHPYTPYDVQLEFMKAVFDVLETGNGQVGILESPTGTVREMASTLDL